MPLYVLDTDILSLFQRGHPSVCAAAASHSPDDLAVTVLTVEEQLSGWYSLLRQSKKRSDLAAVYRRLAENVQFLARIKILSFTEEAMIRYDNLRVRNLGIRAMDLRIAAIALEQGAILVTRNLRDFERVPGLTVENWT